MFQVLKRDFLSSIFYKMAIKFRFLGKIFVYVEKYVKSEQKLLAEWAVKNVCFKKK